MEAVNEIRAGTSGFAYKPWKGSFCPAEIPDTDMLAYYAEHLSAIDINNTLLLPAEFRRAGRLG